MKRLIGILLAVMMLAASAASAEDLSTMTDDELKTLLTDVRDELRRRGLDEEPQPDAAESGDQVVPDRLMQFLAAWSANSLDAMLPLCDPAWASETENPKTELFGLMMNRTPMTAEPQMIHDETDGTRTVDVIMLMNMNNGKDPVKFRYSMVMRQAEDGQWYVNPRCLRDSEKMEELPPETATAEPELSGQPGDGQMQDVPLFYVPEGGEKYHLDENCRAVHDRYLPMSGVFLYSELNYDDYKNLEPCAVCGAPPREGAPEPTGACLRIYDRSGIERVSYLKAVFYAGGQRRGEVYSCPDEGEDFCRFRFDTGNPEDLKDLRIEFSCGVSDLEPEDAILEVMKGNPAEEHPLLAETLAAEAGTTLWMELVPADGDGEEWQLLPAEAE